MLRESPWGKSMRVNAAKRLLTVKVVYDGPGLSGKTTNILALHERFPNSQCGEVLQLDTETERTLFFDYFPMYLGRVRGYRVKVDFFTVPGQSFYHATRKAVLDGADGIAFIADSTPSREEANLVSKEDMRSNIEAMGRDLSEVPLVYQWNKRDVRRPIPLDVLRQTINTRGRRRPAGHRRPQRGRVGGPHAPAGQDLRQAAWRGCRRER